MDRERRELVDLAVSGLGDLPSIGAKAAQLAELGHITSNAAACPGPIPLPLTPFAIPMLHYLEHFERSGARWSDRRGAGPCRRAACGRLGA